jgi:type II secretory pathway pseudopilin PulG
MSRPSRSTVRGMTITEVLIASTLLAFVVAASLSALSAGLSHVRHARMTMLAGQVTQSAIEQLRLGNYTTITAYAAQSQPVSFDSVISSDHFTSGFTTNMHVSVTFSTQVASSSGVLGKTLVTVTTTWPENGVTFTRKATTTFSEKGMSDYIYAGWSNI